MLNLLVDLVCVIGNGLMDAVNQAWGQVSVDALYGGAGWLGRLNGWVPVREFGQLVGILGGVLGVVMLVKWGRWGINLVRGAGS